MLRQLMLTTAIATMVLAPSSARAELEVTLGGYVNFQAGFFNNDNANSSDRDFQSESEVRVTAKGKTDAGLEYGAYLELFTSTSDSDNSDESNIYIAGNWGRVELGDQDGAGSELAVIAPYVGIGQALGSYLDYVPAADRVYGVSETAGDPNVKALDSADATKVTYYTPRMEGFQAGVSYAPERDSNATGEQVQFSDNVGNHDDVFEIGANYKNTFSDIDVKVGGQYTFAGAKTGAAVEDINAWSLGAQLGYKGFTLGGAYVDNGDSAQATGVSDDNVTSWNLGLTYNADAWAVGINYIDFDLDTNGVPLGSAGASATGGDYSAWGFGGLYKIAPGLTAGADFVSFERNRTAGTDTDGYAVVTEVKVAF